MAVLFTKEIVDAAIARITSGTYTFTPNIVQEGSLAHYVENPTLSSDLPAILVVPISVTSDPYDLGAHQTHTTTILRVLLLDQWSDGQEVVDRKMDRTEEIAERFWSVMDMAASITGFRVHWAIPRRIDFYPPEDAELALDQERRLWATTFEIEVKGEANRI